MSFFFQFFLIIAVTLFYPHSFGLHIKGPEGVHYELPTSVTDTVRIAVGAILAEDNFFQQHPELEEGPGCPSFDTYDPPSSPNFSAHERDHSDFAHVSFSEHTPDLSSSPPALETSNSSATSMIQSSSSPDYRNSTSPRDSNWAQEHMQEFTRDAARERIDALNNPSYESSNYKEASLNRQDSFRLASRGDPWALRIHQERSMGFGSRTAAHYAGARSYSQCLFCAQRYV